MIDQVAILDQFEVSLRELAAYMIDDLKKELSEQGHILTGTLRDSIEVTGVRAAAGSQEAFVSLEDYFGIVDRGIRSNRIPFNPGSGRKTSKYIDGLIRFWMIKKGLDEKEATRAAFALAHKHKREGMPTQSSWQFSQNGRRMDFFTRTLDDDTHKDEFEKDIQDELEKVSTFILDNFENAIT